MPSVNGSAARPAIPNPPKVNAALSEAAGRDLCLRARIFALDEGGSDAVFAVLSQDDELLRDALQLRLRRPVRLVEKSPEFIAEGLQRLETLAEKAEGEGLLNELMRSDVAVGDTSSLEEIRRKSQAEPLIKLVNHLIHQAIVELATDIHVEPGEQGVKIRYRKDGMLKDAMDLPKWVQASMTSRIKILADLDIAEKRLPQDGRIKWPHEGEFIDLRVSTLPTRVGEKIVVRILKHLEQISQMESLGMLPDTMQAFRSLIHRPQGMLFVTGPTGSGKSSSLYAALREILGKDINVSTIEDPIEYRLDGANQVQIHEKAGLTFASALRSLLRQDPDVIMVGEIRDEETASIAVQAAQTGHLVFSTLHTNDAPSAVTRLLDLNIKPFLISSAVLGVLSQRLVRKLCPRCKTMQPPSADEKIFLPNLPDLCPTAQGCPSCQGTGYRGRTGIFELLLFDGAVREAILSGKTDTDIKRVAAYRSLVQDGMEKLKLQWTTAAELIRVAVMETQL